MRPRRELPAEIFRKVANAGYRLPTPLPLISKDLGINGQKLASAFKKCDPLTWDINTRLFGNTRYALFGRECDVIVALKSVSAAVQGADNRAVIATLNTEVAAVKTAYGSECAKVITGYSSNAKNKMVALWLPDLRQCGYLARETAPCSSTGAPPFPSAANSISTAAPSIPPPSPARAPELPGASAAGFVAITPARAAVGAFVTPNAPNAGVAGTPQTRSSGAVPEAVPPDQNHARGNKLWARFWKDVEEGAVDPGVICVFQLVQAHKKVWGTRQFKKRAAELGKAKDPFRTKVLYEVMGNCKEGPSKVDFSRFVLLFQDFCLSKTESNRRLASRIAKAMWQHGKCLSDKVLSTLHVEKGTGSVFEIGEKEFLIDWTLKKAGGAVAENDTEEDEAATYRHPPFNPQFLPIFVLLLPLFSTIFRFFLPHLRL